MDFLADTINLITPIESSSILAGTQHVRVKLLIQRMQQDNQLDNIYNDVPLYILNDTTSTTTTTTPSASPDVFPSGILPSDTSITDFCSFLLEKILMGEAPKISFSDAAITQHTNTIGNNVDINVPDEKAIQLTFACIDDSLEKNELLSRKFDLYIIVRMPFIYQNMIPDDNWITIAELKEAYNVDIPVQACTLLNRTVISTSKHTIPTSTSSNSSGNAHRFSQNYNIPSDKHCEVENIKAIANESIDISPAQISKSIFSGEATTPTSSSGNKKEGIRRRSCRKKRKCVR
jgi:hypothetical protein